MKQEEDRKKKKTEKEAASPKMIDIDRRARSAIISHLRI